MRKPWKVTVLDARDARGNSMTLSFRFTEQPTPAQIAECKRKGRGSDEPRVRKDPER